MARKKQNRKLTKKKGRRYQRGGSMYQDNTVQAAGQGGKGSTSNIVFQESDPAILKAKLEAMEEEKARLREVGETTAQELKAEESQSKVDIQNAADKVGSKAEGIAGLAGEGVNIADEFGAFDNLKEKGKEAEKARLEKFADKNDLLTVAGAASKNDALIAEFGKDVFTKTQTPEMMSKINNFRNFGSQAGLADDVYTGANLGTEVTGLTSGVGDYGMGSLGTSAPPPIPSAPVGVTPPPTIITDTTGTVSKSVANIGGNELAKQAGRFGAEGVGTGIGKFASSGAGLGTIATLAGKGIEMASNDKDPTTLNFGEGSGKAIAGAGAGMGLAATAGALYGSSLGPVGTAVGAVGGAIYGLGKGLIERKKARAEKAKFEREKKEKIDKYNKELMGNYSSQMARVKAGELEQKTYSGYDLGRNLTYQLGGRMQPLMKYV